MLLRFILGIADLGLGDLDALDDLDLCGAIVGATAALNASHCAVLLAQIELVGS